MQNFTQIIGMPVISVYSCELVGTVINMQISTQKNKIANLIISSAEDDITYLLPVKKVYAVEACVLIRNKQVLSVTSELIVPSMINLQTFGLSGKDYGKIKELVLDEKWNITKILANEELDCNKLLDYNFNIALFNDTPKKLHLHNFSPKQYTPNSVQTEYNPEVSALAEESETSISAVSQNSTVATPRTITARLPSSFRTPK